MSQRKATYTCQSSGRGRGCSTATPSLCPALWCSPVCPSVQMGQRAEQSSHYLIGKKMPFSLSSTFAQTLSSFVRAVLPHTLCPACTRTHTHTHTIVLGIGIYTCPLSCGKLRRKPQHLTLDGFLAISHPCNSCSRFLYNLRDTRLHGGSGGLRWIIVGIRSS